MNKKIYFLNGPNINFLGIRELEKYGEISYANLIDLIKQRAKELNVETEYFQSNIEGEIVDYIQSIYDKYGDWIIINPGAYTHTSIAIRDALLSIKDRKKIIEVHLTNPNSREGYRKINLIQDLCEYSIQGEGAEGYVKALEYVYEKK